MRDPASQELPQAGLAAENLLDSTVRSAEVSWHLASTGERKLQKEGCKRRDQVVGSRPGLGLSSHVATTVLNRLTHLSIAKGPYAESWKTDFSSRYINLLPRPFIEQYLMRILCSDLSILILYRYESQKWWRLEKPWQESRLICFLYYLSNITSILGSDILKTVWHIS
jgi:hypothetical protein